MSETSTYSVTEIVGTSPDSVAIAMQNGVHKVSESLHNIDWVEVTQIRGHVEEGEIKHYQVQMKVGFRVD